MIEHSAGHISEIPPNEGRMLRVGGHLVAVFHLRDGQVRAVQPWCPHRRGPLVDGLVGDGTLVCPLHGRTFDLASGEALQGESGVATYRARLEADGTILLELPADGPLPCTVDHDAEWAPTGARPPEAPFAEPR
jgi:nitrite reductase (NADH) small subunit